MKATYTTQSPEETMALAMQLLPHLEPGLPVLLYGDLGSGKTHFIKGLAKGLGLKDIIKSPTFTYVNEYPLEGKGEGRGKGVVSLPFSLPLPSASALYHYDLYRLDSPEAARTVGLEDTLNDPRALNVIEWADRLGAELPEHHIRVDCRVGDNGHTFEIEFFDPQIVPEVLVERFWEQWQTPLHVRNHCKQVAQVALSIGEAFVKKNLLVNLTLIQTAALLHDLTRVCDFREMDRTKFQEEVTEEKWSTWLAQREAFKGMHHADIGCGVLLEAGYNKTAEVVRLHNSLRVLEEWEKFVVPEIALVYYADKRVKHDQVVDLAERYRDGRLRNGGSDAEKKKKHEQAQLKKLELEKQIFSLIDMEPGELV